MERPNLQSTATVQQEIPRYDSLDVKLASDERPLSGVDIHVGRVVQGAPVQKIADSQKTTPT